MSVELPSERPGRGPSGASGSSSRQRATDVAGADRTLLRGALGGWDPADGPPPAGPYAALAHAALGGHAPEREAALACLRAAGPDLAHLLGAAFLVRERHFGRRVKVCILQNARSGLCPEDCHYCSQSAISTAEIPRYRMRSPAELVEGARRAAAAGARRYCMVASGRGPADRDVEHLAEAARAIRAETDLELCVSVGLMSEPQARQLRAAGVGWVNHNLNTSRRFYPAICTTHTYDDRLETLRNVQRAGLATCSGVIVGMGETDDDLVEVAGALRGLAVTSLPVNFLHPIDGTPLAGRDELSPARALAALCLFRLFSPASDLRAAGGRERALGPLQPLVLYAASSIFAEGYLTTPGQAAPGARAMVEAMGFEIEG
jgi:biotin synthase